MNVGTNRQSEYNISPLGPDTDHTPAQHVSEAYKAHISQFKRATMAGLKELLAEV